MLFEKEKYKKISISNLLALCYILDDYKEFDIRLKKFISSKYNRNIIEKLRELVDGNKYIYSIKVKDFYKENKSIIDRINNYSTISHFICSKYDASGKVFGDSYYDYFYDYLYNNKDNINKVIQLLNKVKKYGFIEIYFDDKTDFSNYNYSVDKHSNCFCQFAYLDNMIAIPNYENDTIKYTTTSSNYKIMLECNMFDKISVHKKDIMLNSLFFDVNSLPNELLKITTFDKILQLKEQIKDNCDKIHEFVDLRVSVDDMNNILNSTKKIVEALSNADNKNELLECLSKIKEQLLTFKSIRDEYENKIFEENPTITKEQIQEEKKNYLIRRESIKYDVD